MDVDLVELTVTVKDGQGRYVTGLEERNFRIREDGIEQKIASFSRAGSACTVFVLFDTSDAMYEGFARAVDAVAGFIRGLEPSSTAAVSTFSANLYRAVGPTRDRFEAIAGLRQSVAGSGTALYNALLLTLRDAARVPGRKSIVVFSNGPDDASIIGPDDVRRVAEDNGIPIHIVSSQGQDQSTRAAFDRLTAGTGGGLYYAKGWKKQVDAFEAIGQYLHNAYAIAYYPGPNGNRGFRTLKVEVAPGRGKQFHVATRPGYRPRRTPEENSSNATLAGDGGH
jgi:VWFA-related protein